MGMTMDKGRCWASNVTGLQGCPVSFELCHEINHDQDQSAGESAWHMLHWPRGTLAHNQASAKPQIFGMTSAKSLGRREKPRSRSRVGD